MSEWRPIPGYEGRYEVSDDGEVRSLARVVIRRNGAPIGVQERAIRPYKASKRGGYLCVQLHLDGHREIRTIHSLVAEAFIGPRPTGCDVCHGDGDPENNRPWNLRYDTRAGNISDTKKHGRVPQGSAHWATKVDAEKREKISRLRADGMTHLQIAKLCGVSGATVSLVLSGKAAA